MADLEFEVAKRRTEPITFTLGPEPAYAGEVHTYSFVPPKSAVMMMPVIDSPGEVNELGIAKATFDWLGQGLSDEDNERIIARLRDPEDDFDTDTLSKIVEGLSNKVAGRPST